MYMALGSRSHSPPLGTPWEWAKPKPMGEQGCSGFKNHRGLRFLKCPCTSPYSCPTLRKGSIPRTRRVEYVQGKEQERQEGKRAGGLLRACHSPPGGHAFAARWGVQRARASSVLDKHGGTERKQRAQAARLGLQSSHRVCFLIHAAGF